MKIIFILHTLLTSTTVQESAIEASTFSDITAMSVVLFFFLLMVIALLLICREAICWYFKINRILEKQEEILRLMKEKDKKE
ncbi:MAG: hypothetical protein IJF00_05010 [Bacteroidaceae bacterium]|nr:hypothetical protein [Bacteroidaceae bacterium]